MSTGLVDISRRWLKEKPSHFLPIVYNFLWLITYFTLPFAHLYASISITFIILQSYYFVVHFEYDYFLQFSSFYFASITVFVLNIVMIVGANRLDSSCNRTKRVLTYISSANYKFKSAKNQRRFDNTLFRANVMFITNAIIICINISVDTFYWISNVEKEVLIYSIVETFLGSLTKTLWPYFTISFSLNIALWAMFAASYFMYFVFQNIVATLMLTDQLMVFRETCYHQERKKIIKSERSATHVKLDEKYVLNTIKSIAKKQLEIRRSNYFIIESIQLTYFLYLCGGLSVCFLSIFAVFSPSRHTVLEIVNMLGFLVPTYILIETVEEYVASGNRLSAVYVDLNWYNWSTKCQKTYLIGMIQFSQKFKLTFFVWLNINRELFKKIFKVLYPVVNLLFSRQANNTRSS